MGGRHEDIDLRLLSDDLKGELAATLSKFDAGQARCFLNRDRHKLLAVIEAAFGTLTPFNKLVRSIFAAKIEGAGKGGTAVATKGAGGGASATELFSVTV
jgi:hypothetical protein